MKYLIPIVVLFAGGSQADPNTHYVANTDPCDSQCEYYGQACPILTFAPTGPGYDCNVGFCRVNPGENCIAIQEPSRDPHARYVQHTDPCNSQCQYYGQACPIYTFAPTRPGYDCKPGYCRFNPYGGCTAVPRNAYWAENTDACESLCMYAAGCPIRPFAPTPAGFNCENSYCRRTKNGPCIRQMCYKYQLKRDL